MATIVRRPNKDGKPTYLVRIRRKGARPLTATFPKLAEARKWAQITEGAVLEGRHFAKAEAKRHTVGDLIDRYCQDVLQHKRPSTIYGQQFQLCWWKEHLGHYALSEITPALLAEYRDHIARGEGSPRSNATVVRYLAVLSHAFRVAIQEWGWLDDSPMRNVRKPKEPRGRVRCLDDDERTRLLASCQASRNPYLYIVVVIALSTGARRGEILHLTWHDVNLTRGTMTIHDTKNGERRTIPLLGHALDLMHQHATGRRMDTQLVFPSLDGTKPIIIRDAWDYAVKRAGIENLHFHDLRHTAASYLAMNGASLVEIAEILGHKTLAMVKRYAHLSESHSRKVLAQMTQAIFGE